MPANIVKYISRLAFTAAVLVCAATGSAHGQDPRMNNYGTGFGNDAYYDPYSDPYSDQYEGEQQVADTVPPKIRKPLESYFFDDSTRNREIFVWNVDLRRNAVHMTSVDTTISGYQKDYPFLGKRGVGQAWQGNMGGASMPLSFFERPNYYDYSFAQSFDTYYFFPENTLFFNVKKPYANFAYYTAGQTRRREEGFAITHAQNISPSSGFNLDYKSRGTRGYYDWSKGRAKNLSMAFSHTGKKYSVHAGYIYNTINNKENGGIVDDRFVRDTIIELPQSIPVWLHDARNVIKNNTYYLVQSYGVPLRKLTDEDFTISDQSSIFFGHSLTYDRWVKIYSDTRANTFYTKYDENGNAVTSEFYNNWYYDPFITRDSIFESKLANRAFIQIQPWDRDGIVGLIDAGAGMDLHKYYMFTPGDYLTGRQDMVKEYNYYIYGSVQGKFRQYLDWGADVNFHPAGERSGDLRIDANASVSALIRGKPLTLSGKFFTELRSASYWTRNYYSNHFMWFNSFSKEKETRFEVSLEIPFWNLEFGAGQSIITDRIYYNSAALPAQHDGSVSVSGLYASKVFRIGGFNFDHRVLLQWSTSDAVIPVPLASAYLNYYFEFNVVRDVLRARIGLDARYNTKYYAPGYQPATASFYNQREKKLGGYPLIDFYVSGKWKRMRILLKMEHLNEDMFGQRNYFTLLHYPLNRRVFKMGFSWAFYD